ncbi:MAG: FkbM family methyltransferase [Candidatus Atribacteria bacterium]|nr:FkbM family methyltransferase [Candidatus Atribacteria bacterium]MBE3122187.1 FkbM family methyltransferase [Thermoplasmata archaeon]MBE3139219.1 FkbM family methyltransferase [Thermoplasmata archaeon]
MNPTEKAGVHREVVEHDCYKMKELKFVPDVIFDIGANVGVFTRYAHDMFPEADIIAVEPDQENFNTFMMKDVFGITLLQKAIGQGKIYRLNNRWGGAQECYHGVMMGYPEACFDSSTVYKPTEVEAITLADLVDKYVSDDQKFMVKIDCEGAENHILEHSPSIEALMKADYFSIELHYYSAEVSIIENTDNILNIFGLTHNCQRVTNMFYATKKGK